MRCSGGVGCSDAAVLLFPEWISSWWIKSAALQQQPRSSIMNSLLSISVAAPTLLPLSDRILVVSPHQAQQLEDSTELLLRPQSKRPQVRLSKFLLLLLLASTVVILLIECPHNCWIKMSWANGVSPPTWNFLNTILNTHWIHVGTNVSYGWLS